MYYFICRFSLPYFVWLHLRLFIFFFQQYIVIIIRVEAHCRFVHFFFLSYFNIPPACSLVYIFFCFSFNVHIVRKIVWCSHNTHHQQDRTNVCFNPQLATHNNSYDTRVFLYDKIARTFSYFCFCCCSLAKCDSSLYYLHNMFI